MNAFQTGFDQFLVFEFSTKQVLKFLRKSRKNPPPRLRGGRLIRQPPSLGNPFFSVSRAFPCEIPLSTSLLERNRLWGIASRGLPLGTISGTLSRTVSRDSLWTVSQGGILDSWGQTTLGPILPELLGVVCMTFFRLFFFFLKKPLRDTTFSRLAPKNLPKWRPKPSKIQSHGRPKSMLCCAS